MTDEALDILHSILEDELVEAVENRDSEQREGNKREDRDGFLDSGIDDDKLEGIDDRAGTLLYELRGFVKEVRV